MRHVLHALNGLVHGDEGQDLVEYGLLAAMIACLAIGVVSAMGNTIQNTLWTQVVNLAQNL